MKNSAPTDYYIVCFELEQLKRYLLWYSNIDDKEQFVLKADGQVLYFDNLQELKQYCVKKDLQMDDEIVYFTLHRTVDYSEMDIDCSKVLNLWNIISDFAYTVGDKFIGDDKERNEIDEVYVKLFRGCNIKAMKQSFYHPVWNVNSRQVLEKVMKDGIKMVLRHLYN